MKDTNDHPQRGAAAGLRLALFSGNYNYTRDGANQALNRLVGYLEDHGAQVRVYSPTTSTPAFAPRGELVSAPSVPLPGRGEYRLALGMPRQIRRDIEAFAPTCIHLSAPDILGVKAQKLARRLGVPVVASLHTRFETYLRYYGLGWLRGPAERFLGRFYGGCDRVLAPNAPLLQSLRAELGDRVSLWSRGVDRAQFSPARRDAAWREAQGLKDGQVALLFLGRLVMEKGLDVFADTVALLREQGRDVRPLVVGDGPARSWLEARLPDASFTGLLAGEALGRAVASADILFNPSRTEAFGNVTLEAMAAGLAVVCPDAPSTRELVQDDQTGVIVQIHEPAAYAEAIGALLDDAQRRRRLGGAATHASGRYDWANSSAAVLEVYRQVGGLAEPSCA